MSRKAGWSAFFVVILALGSGCGGPGVSFDGQEPDPNVPPPPPPPPKGHDRVFRLDDPLEVSLADLLRKPRKELAAMADDWLQKVRILEKKQQTGELVLNLTPDLRFPLVVPVFRRAKYSERLQLSLPPYLEEDKKDNAVALHLARFGDGEAALLLAEPAVQEEIKANRGPKNYPVEWSRLVALQLYVAQVRLAAGEPEGARQLVGLHRQLREVLDPQTRKAPLGALLLSRGREVLTAAARAWRKESQADPTKLADQAEAALADWGETTPAQPFIPWGGKGAEVARLLDTPVVGHAIAVRHPERAFDLLDLPFPEASAEGVVAGLDASGELADLLVIYRARITEEYTRPVQLGLILEQTGLPGTSPPPSPGLLQRSYRFGGKAGAVTVTLAPAHTEVGGLVQFRKETGRASAPTLPRQLGAVDLDESFDANRVRLALHQQGAAISVTGQLNLGSLAGLTGVLPSTRAVLERDQGDNLVHRLTLHFAESPQGLMILAPLVSPLVSLGGPAQVSGEDGPAGRNLVFSWYDGHTRCALRLPQGRERTPELEVTDATLPEGRTEQARRVTANDQARRAARLKNGKPDQRIPRTREQIKLGMTRAEVNEALPTGKGIKQRTLPDGIGIIFNEVPDEHPGYIPRELFVRFGPGQRVAEVRVRYTDAPDSPGGLDRLLAKVRETAGAPVLLPGPWAKVWKGFPRRAPAPVLYRWQDDLSLLTCQRDSEGVELALRDCPPDQPDGLALPLFQCLPDGPAGCRLGDSREEPLRRWKDTGPEVQKGQLVLTPQGGPYDLLLVTFADTKAVRILARNRRQWPSNPGHEELGKAVRRAWAESFTFFGYPRREDSTSRKEMQTWTSHDDATRVSIFWQENRAGTARVYTEWSVIGAP